MKAMIIIKVIFILKIKKKERSIGGG